jgi:hypothetical protein
MTTCCTGDSKYYVGDAGTKIVVNVCVDITTATVRSLKVMKPSGVLVTWPGLAEGTTHIAYYVQPTDFDEEGTYRLQAYVEMPGWKGHGDTAKFKVTKGFE